jgi:hypothetical protein
VSIDLLRFDAGAMRQCSRGIQACTGSASSIEAAAGAFCRFLYDELAGSAEERACVMVRCYTTRAYGELPDELQRYAKRALGVVAITPPDRAMKCLALLATVGDEEPWNDRRSSKGHQAIPLPSPHIVERAPMVAQLIQELGFQLDEVVRRPTQAAPDLIRKTYGIFHVEEAAGSPYIPAQEGFVQRYGIQSVLGFGGALPGGDILATILFSRVPISVAAAERFRALALELTTGLGKLEPRVFADSSLDLDDTAARE